MDEEEEEKEEEEKEKAEEKEEKEEEKEEKEYNILYQGLVTSIIHDMLHNIALLSINIFGLVVSIFFSCTFLTGTQYDSSSHTHHQQHPGYYYHHHCP